jgi:radical SAM superfamily enzyme YgiQ (UPF0313 family)
MTSNYNWFKQVNDKIKCKYGTRIKTIVGGPHFTFTTDGELDINVDFVVKGHGEEALPQIVDGSITNKTIKGAYCGVKYFKLMDRSIIYDTYARNRESSLKTFITMRECPFNCVYCHQSKYKAFYRHEKLYGRYPAQEIVHDIIETQRRYGCGAVYFYDDDFLINKSWLCDFNECYKRLIPYACMTNISTVNEDNLRLAINSGCKLIYLSVESADMNTRKVLDRPVITNEEIITKLNMIRKLGLHIRASFIIGIPYIDSIRDAFNNLQFCYDNDLRNATASILQPYPSTMIYDELKSRNMITGDCDELRGQSCIRLNDVHVFNNLVKLWHIFCKYKVDIEFVKHFTNLNIQYNPAFMRHLDTNVHDMRLKLLNL